MEEMEQILQRVQSSFTQKNYNESTAKKCENPENSEKKSNSHFKCDKCNDLGVIWRTDESGDLYAKNCECTLKQIIRNKAAFANIPIEFQDIKVNDFQINRYNEQESMQTASQAKKLVGKYVLNFKKLQAEGKGLYFHSKTKGSGKTMLAIALGNALINTHGCNVKFATMVDVLAEVKNGFNQESNSNLIETLTNIEVLIIDDIGTERLTGWSNEVIYQLINTRMTNKLVTMFTSNGFFKELRHDERIVSRIERMAIPVQMPEESIRSALAKQENEDILKDLLGG